MYVMRNVLFCEVAVEILACEPFVIPPGRVPPSPAGQITAQMINYFKIRVSANAAPKFWRIKSQVGYLSINVKLELHNS